MNEKDFCNQLKEQLGAYLERWQKKTAETGKEIGGIICQKDNALNLEAICFGEQCRVTIKGACPKSSAPVALFHTHPIERGLTKHDVETSAEFKYDHTCVVDSRGDLECASNLQNLVKRRQEFKKSMDELLKEVMGRRIPPAKAKRQYWSIIQRLGVKFCRLKIK